MSWEGGTELLDLVDLMDKSAEGCLNCILLIWGRLNDIQRELAVPPTPLYAIRTLYADNASVNAGVAGGLAGLLEEARKAAHARDDSATPYLPLKFKGCDDHIWALVLTRFNTLFCEWAENAGRLDLVHNRKDKIGVKEKVSKIATPLYALKRIQPPQKRGVMFLTPPPTPPPTSLKSPKK